MRVTNPAGHRGHSPAERQRTANIDSTTPRLTKLTKRLLDAHDHCYNYNNMITSKPRWVNSPVLSSAECSTVYKKVPAGARRRTQLFHQQLHPLTQQWINCYTLNLTIDTAPAQSPP